MKNDSLKNLKIDLTEIGNSANQSSTNLQKKLNTLKIDHTTKVEKPLSILSSYNKNEKFIPLGYESALLTLTGKAKSRKSFYLAILTASISSNKPILSTYKNEIISNNYKVLYFDTEQGKYHASKAFQRICKILEVDKLDCMLSK